MHLQLVETYEALSQIAAARIVEAVRRKPDLLLCLATGQTPLRTYALLADYHREDPVLFSQVRILKLDEWLGLPPTAPETCEVYLKHHVLGPLGIRQERFFGFQSDAADGVMECARMDAIVKREGPIDLCILGVGTNGHLGFIEPGTDLSLHAHVATLEPSSRQHTMVQSMPEPPTHGLTLGLADVMTSGAVMLLVSGTTKQEALKRLLKRRIQTQFPASLLWLHPNVLCLYDQAALPDQG